MLCVEFLQVKYIDVSDITHVLKAAAVTNSEHLNLSMIFGVHDGLCSPKKIMQIRLRVD